MSRDEIPSGARAVARVLVLDSRDRLFLLQAQESIHGDHRWWVAPGGGLEAGESFEDAAHREVHEETGMRVELGPWVWTRRHIYEFRGRRFDQYERYFASRALSEPTTPSVPDDYVVLSRWWSPDELRSSDETFTPRRLAALITDVIAGRYPERPFDCGI